MSLLSLVSFVAGVFIWAVFLRTWYGMLHCRRVARISQREGGAVLEVWYNRKRTSPKFSLDVNEIESVFLTNFDDLQKILVKIWAFLAENRWSPKKKKKIEVFTDCAWAPGTKIFHYSGQTTASPSQLRLPNPFEGAVFIFRAKIGLKITKKEAVVKK